MSQTINILNSSFYLALTTEEMTTLKKFQRKIELKSPKDRDTSYEPIFMLRFNSIYFIYKVSSFNPFFIYGL